MTALTWADWQRAPEEYRHIGRDGKPYVLCMDPETGATVLAPVTERTEEERHDDS